MQLGERQVAPTIDGIRKDHRARYEWVGNQFRSAAHQPNPVRMIDVGCGVGYGCSIMVNMPGAAIEAFGFDVDVEAVTYANQHYATKGAQFKVGSPGNWLKKYGPFDAAVCFEMIEHLEDPEPLLRGLRELTGELFASVPNEEVFPWKNYAFHFRHYTRAEFDELLERCGWRVLERWGQVGPESNVGKGIVGRTYIVRAVRDNTVSFEDGGEFWPTTKKASVVSIHNAVDARGASQELLDSLPETLARHNDALEERICESFRQGVGPRAFEAVAPETVCILGMGPSLQSYLHNARSVGGRRELADEVWAVNVLGDVLQCDRVFHMDDVRVQEIRAAAAPHSNIANWLKWLKTHPGPIYTSQAHPEYPGTVEYPLEDVLNSCAGQRYFNGTVPYAVAFAIHIGVKKIHLYGCDFTYPNAHEAEKGRACLEYWLGFARARGVLIAVSAHSTLMDSRERTKDVNQLYGYDGVKLDIVAEESGHIRVTRTPKALPTAEEIEARYDHSRHPNSLVEEGG